MKTEPGFAEAIKYNCIFNRMASSSVDPKKAFFNFTIVHDPIAKKAFITGNTGVNGLHPVNGFLSVTFLEVLETGAVQSTTITTRGAAVHSRHTIIDQELTPSQYYGTCREL
jgi:hypothetical protein